MLQGSLHTVRTYYTYSRSYCILYQPLCYSSTQGHHRLLTEIRGVYKNKPEAYFNIEIVDIKSCTDAQEC